MLLLATYKSRYRIRLVLQFRRTPSAAIVQLYPVDTVYSGQVRGTSSTHIHILHAKCSIVVQLNQFISVFNSSHFINSYLKKKGIDFFLIVSLFCSPLEVFFLFSVCLTNRRMLFFFLFFKLCSTCLYLFMVFVFHVLDFHHSVFLKIIRNDLMPSTKLDLSILEYPA